jgi:hypothetical protein
MTFHDDCHIDTTATPRVQSKNFLFKPTPFAGKGVVGCWAFECTVKGFPLSRALFGDRQTDHFFGVDTMGGVDYLP